MATVQHDMKQGFVLTQYFYEQMIQFEKDPASLKDTIGEMVYSMDVDQQVHRARQIEFDKEADAEVLGRSKPHKLTGMDLAEAQLSNGDIAGASAMAQQALAKQSDTVASDGRQRARLLHPGQGGGPDRASGAGDRRLPEDAGHQQGTAAAGLVAHLPGPHAGPGLQARSRLCRNTSWR